MADESGQSEFSETMTMQEALDRANTQIDNLDKEAPKEEASQEAQQDEVETEAREAEPAETETSEEAEVADDQAEDGPQVLDLDTYGDVQVQVGDETITIKDLAQREFMQADYSRKTAALAEQRKSLEAEMAEKEQALAERESQLNERLSSLDGEPDWVALAQEDPLGWVEQKAAWDAKKAVAEQAKEAERVKQEKAVREFSKVTAQKAIEVFPEWSDAKKFDSGGEARKAAALAAGFTDAEYAQAHDFRLAVLLEKAARWDASQKETKKAVDVSQKRISAAPKVLKPGQSKGPVDPADERKAARQKRFSQPGGISTSDIGRMLGRN